MRSLVKCLDHRHIDKIHYAVKQGCAGLRIGRMPSPESSSLVCQGDRLWDACMDELMLAEDCAQNRIDTAKNLVACMCWIPAPDFTLHVICIAIQLAPRSILSLESSCKLQFVLWTSALAQGNNHQVQALSATIAVQALQVKPNAP